MFTPRFDSQAMRDSIDRFLTVYEKRPLPENYGGMGLNHSWATWFILDQLQPALVVESGIFRGHSTWLIEQAAPNAQIKSFDISLTNRKYISERAEYFECDFTQADWSETDTSNALCFFDDHQNSYQRLIQMHWLGFTAAIFEDNWPVGEGDSYSLKHLFAGVGADSVQMSRGFLGSRSEQRKRSKLEKTLRTLGHRQDLLVKSNSVDTNNLQRRLEFYSEVPPLKLAPLTMWNTPWTDNYATLPEVAPERDFGSVDLSYSYLAFVQLTN